MWLRIQADYGLQKQKLVVSSNLRTYDNELEDWIISFFKQSLDSFKLKPDRKNYSNQE